MDPPILRVCNEPAEVPDRVLKVVGHEVGHAMGLPESRLRAPGLARVPEAPVGNRWRA